MHKTNQQRIGARLAAVLVAVSLATILGLRLAEAAFPGESGKVVYEGLHSSSENYEICAVDADGSNPTRLTDGAAEDRAPSRRTARR